MRNNGVSLNNLFSSFVKKDEILRKKELRKCYFFNNKLYVCYLSKSMPRDKVNSYLLKGKRGKVIKGFHYLQNSLRG